MNLRRTIGRAFPTACFLFILLLSLFSITSHVGSNQEMSGYLFLRWWIPLWVLGALVSVWCIGSRVMDQKNSRSIDAFLYIPLALLLAVVLYARQHRLPVEYVRDALYYASQTHWNVFYSLRMEGLSACLPVFGYASEFLLGFFLTAAVYGIIQTLRGKGNIRITWREDWKSVLFWTLLPLLVAYAESLSIGAEKLLASISVTTMQFTTGSIDAPWWRWAALFASSMLYPLMLFIIPAIAMRLYHRRAMPRKIIRYIGIAIPIAYLVLLFASPFVGSGFTDLVSALPQQMKIAPTLCMGAFFGIAISR